MEEQEKSVGECGADTPAKDDQKLKVETGAGYTGVDKSEDNSSILFKDSAYSSLGHSASSSMGPIIPPTGIFNQLIYHNRDKKTPSTSGSSLTNSNSSSVVVKSSISTNPSQTSGHNKPLEPSLGRIRVSASSRKKIKTSLEKFREAASESDGKANNFLSSKDSKAAKVATLSQALGYVDQYQRSQQAPKAAEAKEDDIKTLVTNLTEVCGSSKVAPSQRDELNQSLHREQASASENNLDSSAPTLESDGFCVAVSLTNGIVVHTTPSLSSVLGYPKDMWIGRSILDFVHSKDKEHFISQVSENINLPLEKSKSSNIKSKSRNFFCRIRMYNGLKTGFAVKERKKKFLFFKMTVCFSEANGLDGQDVKRDLGDVGIYMFLTAIPLSSPYNTGSNEDGSISCLKTDRQGVFCTKHNSSCVFTLFDDNAVSLLGHFPHEMEGTEVFDIVHPQDLNILKESFEALISASSRHARSHSYRMRTRNGEYVTVVTTWSCFVNPWNQNLEFIHGKHSVVKGPKNPNVFVDADLQSVDNIKASESEKKSSAPVNLQEEIKHLLQNTVRKTHISKLTSSGSIENKKKLSSFMGHLLQEVAKAENFELSRSTLHSAVVIGNISPHQSDSSESPPSYNQLTYNENLTRFFNSQPKTLSEKDVTGIAYSSPESYEDNPREMMKQAKIKDRKEQRKTKSGGSKGAEDGGRSQGGSGQGSGEQQGSGTGKTVSGSGEDNAKNSSSLQIGMSAGHMQTGGEECIMSQDGCTTSGSGSRLGSGSREGVDDYKPPVLTEDLLVHHNREMERQMVSKFKEAKRIGELGFIKDKSKAVGQSESKRVLVKAKVKADETVSKRQHLSTIPENLNKSVSNRQESGGQPQEYQRPLAFTDSYFSSDMHSCPSTPNMTPGNSQLRPEQAGQLQYPLSVGQFVQGHQGEDGQQKFIQVPAIMIPISCANTGANVPSFPANMSQLSLMMQAATPGFIPLMYNMGPAEASDQTSVNRPKPSTSAAAHQFELPNCLAVDSCMTHREIVKDEDSGKKQLKRGAGVTGPRQTTASGDNSQDTSVKGEPGSALESNASAGEPSKTRVGHTSGHGRNQSGQPKQIGEELCSSSQSLYSFLPSSDDNDITDFLQASSSKPDDSEEEKVKNVRQVARPVLSEPFWNEGVTMTESLVNTYQLPELPMESVLRSDRQKLEKMKQSEILGNQLKELRGFMEVGEVMDVMNLFGEEEDETETETTSPDEGEKDDPSRKKRKSIRMRNLERMNMFLEENAPFPENTSPTKVNPFNADKRDCVETSEPVREPLSSKNPSSLHEAFKMAVEGSSSKTRSVEDKPLFTRSKPQESKFRYGCGSESNIVTRGHDHSDVTVEKKKEKGKDSTDGTTSSEEILKTSSSVKTSSDDLDNKRKKGTLSPSSVTSSTFQQDEKKFKCGSVSGSDDKRSGSDSDNREDQLRSGSELNTMN